jgi:hypothetical protein
MSKKAHNIIHKYGNKPWNYGKHHSEETKQKISESREGNTHSEETKKKMSIGKNTSGYYRVTKHKNKRYKQGFRWVYRYYEESKRKEISSVDIKELESKVKAHGLPWRKIKESDKDAS